MPDPHFNASRAGELAWSIFDQAFDGMAPVAEHVETLARQALAERGTLNSSDFTTVKAALLKNIAALPESVIGTCFGFDVGVLEDVAYCMPALARDGSNVQDAGHDLDPESDTFYDYSILDWLAPVTDDAPRVDGPYIDLGGTNKFTITAAIPAWVDGRLIGKVGVDVGLEPYERSLVPLLDHAPGSLSVLNTENRVVVSNDASRAIGTLLHVDPTQLVPCGPYGWNILHLN